MDFEAGGAAAALGGDAGAGGEQGGGGGGAGAAGGEGGQGGGEQGGGEQGGAADPDWYSGLSDKPGEGESAANRDWVKAKGFKDLDGLTKAYRGAEKALHARDSGMVKVPGEGASAEEVASYRKAIGVPDDAKGYAITMPENAGGLALDEGLVGKLAELAHASGLPKAGFETVANAYVQSQIDAHLASVAIEDAGFQAKQAEWGAQAPEKMAQANAAMRAIGLSRADVGRMQMAFAEPGADGQPGKAGSARVLDILSKIGGGIAEDMLATGGSGRWGVTGAEAQAELNAIKNDPAKGAAAMVNGSAEQARFNRLTQIVAEDAVRKSREG